MEVDFEGERDIEFIGKGALSCELRVKGLAKTPRGTPNILMDWWPSE